MKSLIAPQLYASANLFLSRPWMIKCYPRCIEPLVSVHNVYWKLTFRYSPLPKSMSILQIRFQRSKRSIATHSNQTTRKTSFCILRLMLQTEILKLGSAYRKAGLQLTRCIAFCRTSTGVRKGDTIEIDLLGAVAKSGQAEVVFLVDRDVRSILIAAATLQFRGNDEWVSTQPSFSIYSMLISM